jgi:hypothetical protein
MQSSAPKIIRHSGLQKEVLKLYRLFLQEVQKKKGTGEERNRLTTYIRNEFKQKATVSKRDIKRVEYWLSFGKKKRRKK